MSTALKEDPYKKIEYINKLAASGMTRKEIALDLGYTDARSLYAFTFRHGLKWSDKKGLYVIKGTEVEAHEVVEDTPTGKVANIISMFDKKIDGKEIASRQQFSTYQEMADYMKSKGYEWDSKRQNYKKAACHEVVEAVKDKTETIDQASDTLNNDLMSEYEDILRLLKNNKDKLNDLITTTDGVDYIKRYLLPGIVITKSIKMVSPLDKLIKEFSVYKSIKQKDIIEVALVEFFKKYGYSEQVKSVLHV